MGGFIAVVVLGLLIFVTMRVDEAMGETGGLLVSMAMFAGGVAFLINLVASSFATLKPTKQDGHRPPQAPPDPRLHILKIAAAKTPEGAVGLAIELLADPCPATRNTARSEVDRQRLWRPVALAAYASRDYRLCAEMLESLQTVRELNARERYMLDRAQLGGDGLR